MSTGVAVGVGGGVWTCRSGDPDPDADDDTVLATAVEKKQIPVEKTDKFGGVGKKQAGVRETNKQTNKQTNQEFVTW